MINLLHTQEEIIHVEKDLNLHLKISEKIDIKIQLEDHLRKNIEEERIIETIKEGHHLHRTAIKFIDKDTPIAGQLLQKRKNVRDIEILAEGLHLQKIIGEKDIKKHEEGVVVQENTIRDNTLKKGNK